MNVDKASYRQVVKATALFGGVQIVQILVTIIRGKLVAVLLGTAGMGINTLFQSVINMIVQISGLGLSFSAVRDISQAVESQNSQIISRTFTVIRYWLLFSGFLGIISIIIFSSVLSKFTFGNIDYAWSFVWLAIVVFLSLLNSGNLALLQGMRQLRSVAQATLIGSFVGLCSAVPLYWLYGNDGIVPALIVAAFTTFLSGWYFVRKLRIIRVSVSIKETFTEGKEMVKLGVVSMVSALLGSVTVYAINAFISNIGNINDVGLYGAAISISNQYIGVVFTAMAVDFFPRLAAVSNDKIATNKAVNEQAEIVLLIATPLLILMMCSAPLIIRVLLTSEFLVIRDFICWVAFGMIFKAASFPLGYISFAKGDRKMYFWLEGILGNVLMLLLNIGGYYWLGLLGMAISFLLLYILFFCIYSFITYWRYGFVFTASFLKVFLNLLFLGFIAFFITQQLSIVYSYLLGSIIFLISFLYSYQELNKRIGIKEFIISRFSKKA